MGPFQHFIIIIIIIIIIKILSICFFNIFAPMIIFPSILTLSHLGRLHALNLWPVMQKNISSHTVQTLHIFKDRSLSHTFFCKKINKSWKHCASGFITAPVRLVNTPTDHFNRLYYTSVTCNLQMYLRREKNM